MSTKKILVVLTSHSDLGDTGHKTGFWVEEFAAPYYAFIDAGAEVTVATPKGGQAPIDPNSAELLSNLVFSSLIKRRSSGRMLAPLLHP